MDASIIGPQLTPFVATALMLKDVRHAAEHPNHTITQPCRIPASPAMFGTRTNIMIP